MGVIIGIIIFYLLWGTDIGKFLLGNFAKIVYSCIAISICMSIPIPILNVILAIYVVIEIWKSPIG